LNFKEELLNYTKASYPAVWITTQEDERCMGDIMSMCHENSAPLYMWRITKGWQEVGASIPGPTAACDGSQGPDKDIYKIVQLPEGGYYVMMGFHHFLNNPIVLQAMKDIMSLCKNTARHVIFISPEVKLPPDIEKEVVLLDYDLPSQDQMEALFTDLISDESDAGVPIWKSVLQLDAAPDPVPFAQAALGMTVQEAENAFALAVVKHQKTLGSSESVDTVLKQKMQTFKKSGLLDFFPADQDLSGVGGLGEFKSWLHREQVAFQPEMRARHVAMPKGILLMGIPGTGKSMTAKAIAKQWGWPMLKMDIGKLFNAYIGNSEANVRMALKMAEAVAPVVMMVDELDKGMAGLGQSGSTDSGVTARVLGTILTWMQDKTAPVFVVGTVNRVKGLPPELLRKGRFDEIWWVELPNGREREEIFHIHLNKREIKVWDSGWIGVTNGFSGSEIEAVVADALLTALADGREVAVEDIDNSIKTMTPLSKTMAGEIQEMQAWAKDRARMANSAEFDYSGSALRKFTL
jgi:hypothetical protein